MSFQLDFSAAPPEALRGDCPNQGDIYRKAGGPPGFWWVIAVTEGGSAYVLALSPTGRIVGANSYPAHYFERNFSRRVGFAEVPEVTVSWEAHP